MFRRSSNSPGCAFVPKSAIFLAHISLICIAPHGSIVLWRTSKIEVCSMSRPLPPLECQEKLASTSEGVWSPRYRRLTLGLILITLGPAFEGLAVATILPKVVANLGGLSLYGWAFSAYMLATLVGIILAGDGA